jgi:hypothetical protein
MRVLTQADLLSLFDAGRLLHPLDQAVLAVQAAFPESRESVADWPLGQRNRALSKLRCAMFGSAVRGWTRCRQCSEQLEFDVDGQSLSEGTAADLQARVTVSGRSYRLPTSRDLAAVVEERDETAAAERLLLRCCAPQDLPENSWTAEEIDAVGESMAAADPLAEILLSFDCPNCGACFQESLDLASFLWAEVEDRARRMLREVHALASAYGWSEAQILSLGPARREIYLEMVQA